MNECSLQGFLFKHDHPEDFAKIILLYSYAISIWIVCELFIGLHLKIYIFFCAWAQVIYSLGIELGLGKIVENCGKPKTDIDAILYNKVPWHLQFYWASFAASLPALIVSFIVFWTDQFDGNVAPLYIVMGNVTPLVILCEFAIIAFPLRLLHCCYFLIFYLVYIIYTVIYQKLGGTGANDSIPIYKHLDWRCPSCAILASSIGMFIGVAAYVISWYISKLKFVWRNKRRPTQ